MRRQGLIKDSIDIFQLGYRTDVDASANTHAGGGNTDTGQYHAAQIEVWRLWGWTQQRRDLTGVKTHSHGWPWGCTHLSPSAQKQAADWARKDAGLVGSAKVVGRWPVKNWQIAFKENVVSLLGDIKKEIADEVALAVHQGSVVDIYKPPPGEVTSANPTWKFRSEIEWLVENVDAIRKAVEKA